MPYCSRCGKPLDDDTTFCPYCGANQAESSNPYQYQQGAPIPPQQSNKGLIVALVAVVVVLVVAVLAFFLLSSNGKKDKAEATKAVHDTVVVQKETVKEVPVQTQSLPKHASKVNTYPAADPCPQGTYNLSGKVGKYPVKMCLTIEGTDISGYYYYLKHSNASMDLYGDAHGQKLSVFEMEQTNGCTGAFDGQFDGNRFTGTFVNYKGQVFNMTLTVD